MPNVSEFKQECAALGLSHIEVVEGDREPDVTLDMIKNGQVDTITTGTYEYYESELKKLDIVFFSEDDVIQGVTFIGNSVFFAERGGSEESWTYKTHKINIPVDGGVRTFSGAMKDELFAMGVMGIVADSIDDVDNHGNYLDTSLYGKIENKLAALMRKEGATTLEGLKIPWLYNIIVSRCSGSGSGIDWASTFSDHIGRVGQNAGGTERMDSAIYCNFDSFSTTDNTYLYKLGYDFKYNTDGLTWIITGTPKYPVRTGKCSANWVYADDRFLKAWNGQHHATSHGGWNNPMYQGTSGTPGNSDQPINYTKFSTQPYVFGMVFMITHITEQDSYRQVPAISGYITIIGLDKQGHILAPVPPYWTLRSCTIKGQSYNEHVQVRINLTPQEISELMDNGDIDYMPDYSKFSPLKGKTIMEVCIPIRAAELNYAKNVDYIIAPNDLIPEDYFDDDEP